MANAPSGETESGPFLRLCHVQRPAKGSCGFHLSRTQFDPYPWVSGVEPGSAASQAGLRTGDCVLEVNGEDVLGQRIGQVAAKVKDRDDPVVSLLLWNAGVNDGQTQALHKSVPTPLSLQRLNGCLQAVLQLLECPVCLEPVTPPASQCCNGHVLCCGCRSRAERCPVCRVALGPRGRCLLADKLHSLLAAALAPPTPQVVTTPVHDPLILNEKPRRIKSRQPISSSQNNISQEEHIIEDQRLDRPRSLSADQIPNGRKIKRTLGSSPNVILTPSSTEQDAQVDIFLCPHEPICTSRHSDFVALMHHLRSGDHLGPLVQYAVPRTSSTPVILPVPEESKNLESGLVMLVTRKGCTLFIQREDHRLWILSSGDTGFKIAINRGAPIPAVHPLTKSRNEIFATGRWVDLSTPLPKKISIQLFEDSSSVENIDTTNSTNIQVPQMQPQLVN